MPRYRGPYLITDRPSNSTIQIKTGTFANGLPRLEVHHWHNARPAFVGPGTPDATRPKLGRPARPDPTMVDSELTRRVTPKTNDEIPPNVCPPNQISQESQQTESAPNSNDVSEPSLEPAITNDFPTPDYADPTPPSPQTPTPAKPYMVRN